MSISGSIAIETVNLSAVAASAHNARTHSRKQLRQIATSIETFGFLVPVLINDAGELIAGHGRVQAASLLKLKSVPAIRACHLSAAQQRAYRIADNKLTENGGWDQALLAQEFEFLSDIGFDLSVTGFSMPEIDFTIEGAREAKAAPSRLDRDVIPEMGTVAVCEVGQVWHLGRHRLLCGDATLEASYQVLMPGEVADLVFTDPPYNVKIVGFVTGKGQAQHGDFAMGVGEMDQAAFTQFLTSSLGAMAKVSRDGAIAYVCMDWRHLAELLSAGGQAFSELKNLCVWSKTNPGLGSFYRSQHELVFVFKVGSAPHTNNIGLGGQGRYRTNVWSYAGVSSLNPDRAQALQMHPTVKPTAMVVDAIKDCSNRGDIVLDGFVGSGTTLIAAELTGRIARAIEYDPLYCDVVLRRFQHLTGHAPVLASTGETFEALEARDGR